jgi:outer membrane immunogenic protein
MKNLMLGSVALAAMIAGTAMAAPPPGASNWSGPYLGGKVGGGWLNDGLTENSTFIPPQTGHAHYDSSGVVGGLLGGANWQTGRWLIGAEADGQLTGHAKTSTCLIQDTGVGNAAPGTCFLAPPGGYSSKSAMPWQATFRVRGGYAVRRAVVYLTGGLAIAELKTSYSAPGEAAQSFRQGLNGYTFGGGVDYVIDRNWRTGFEYRRTNFNKLTTPILSGDIFWGGYSEIHRVTQDTVSLRIIYLFAAPPRPPPPPNSGR